MSVNGRRRCRRCLFTAFQCVFFADRLVGRRAVEVKLNAVFFFRVSFQRQAPRLADKRPEDEASSGAGAQFPRRN